ncbi:MAG: metal ABC transporter substrate-binding protein [Actinomycetota bacterium]
MARTYSTTRQSTALVAAACLIGMAACAPAVSTGTETSSISVTAAFYPLEFVAEHVGGDLVEVAGLTPPGVEPHDVELTASQVAAGTGADLLIYVGEGFQPAVDDLLGSAQGKKLNALAGQQLLEAFGGHHHGNEADHQGEQSDPHFWLDPTRVVTLARKVAEAFSELYPQASDSFASNADALAAELTELDGEFQSGLADCISREIVTSHEAFAYLADRYGLQQIGIGGLSPESEPSPAKMAEVTASVKEHSITTIFFQEFVTPATAETVARETGSTTSVLSPLEIAPESGDYFTVMRANLQNLRTALECE